MQFLGYVPRSAISGISKLTKIYNIKQMDQIQDQLATDPIISPIACILI